MTPPDNDGQSVAQVLRAAVATRSAIASTGCTPGSVAEFDIADCQQALGTAAPIERVIICADLWTAIAADQLYGMGVILEARDSLFSLFPILRSVIEHCAATTWVLDDKVNNRDRAIRAALAVLRSEEEAVKASARMGGSGTEIHRDAKQRFKGTQQALADEFGTLDGEGGWSLEGVSLPTPTTIVEQFGARWGDARQWSGMYDYLCATANHPSLSGLEYAVVDAANQATGFTVEADMLNRLVRAGLVPFIKAMEYYCQYMGWNCSPLDDYIDRVNAALGDVVT